MAGLKYRTSNGEWKTLKQYTVITPSIEQTTGDSTSAVMSQKAVSDEVTKLQSQIDNAVTGGKYDSQVKEIQLTHGDTVLAHIDATDFIKDGMVDNVEVKDGKLVITFNTDSGKEAIEIEISKIFDATNYYNKTEADGKFGTLTEQNQLRSDVEDAMGEIASLEADKADKSELEKYETVEAHNADKAELTQSLDSKADAATVNTELGKKLDKTTYETDKATFETSAHASETYATKTAISDMLTKTEAGNTYATKADAATKAELTEGLGKKLDTETYDADKPTFETKENAVATYLTKTDAENTYETIEDHDKDYKAIMSRIEDVAQVYSIYGMARVNGDTSPSGTRFFGNEENFKTIANIVHLGLVDGNGKLYKRCANGRVDLAADGTGLNIDGTDGDVMLYIDSPIYVCRFTDIVKDDSGTSNEMNVFAVGLTPFTIEGHNAKALKPFAFSPQYTVNAKIGDDKRVCAHSVYNKAVAGQYGAANGTFKDVTSFKADGNGFPSNRINAMQSIWYGQSKNEDEKTNRPFMGGYYEFTEVLLMLMYLENKSLYHQALDDFGCGSTMSNVVTDGNFCTGDMAGNSGVKLFYGDGNNTTRFIGIMQQGAMNGNYPLVALVGGDYYVFTEMLEIQRLLNDISKAGLVNKIWKNKEGDDDNKTVIFEYDGDNIKLSNITIDDINTGSENMVVGKKYYQVRNTKTCQGMADGIMTAVANIFVKFEFNSGIKCGNDTMADGNYAVWKFSHAIYRGMSLSYEGMFTQMQGCHYVRVNAPNKWNTTTNAFDGGLNDNNTIDSFFIAAENVDEVPAIESSSVEYFGDYDADLVMEKGLSKKVWVNNTSPQGWAEKADYNMSLFCLKPNYNASINTKECSWLWNYASWGNGDSGTLNSNGTPRNGRKCVNAVAVGCHSISVPASARAVDGSRAVGSSPGLYAGRFSLPYLIL